MVIVHIHVDCRDAMGANAVNTMAETIAPKVEEITGGTVILEDNQQSGSPTTSRVVPYSLPRRCQTEEMMP